MKTLKIITLSMMLTFAFTGCKQEKSDSHDHDAMVVSEGEENHANEDNNEPIALNDGKKWEANAEMKPFIMKGEALVAEYDGDYKMLAENLTDQNNQLIKSCTMEGTSHDELHKWLHPHLEMVKELKDMDDQAIADAKVKEIKTSYDSYHQYFE